MALSRDELLAIARIALISISSMTLYGCSFSYPIDVGFLNGNVVFSAARQSSGCLSSLEVTSETGQSMWKFEGPLRFTDCRSEFPLVYGHVPSGTNSAGPAIHLKPNVKYYIYASDGDTYYGSFQIKLVMRVDSDPQGGRNGPFFNGSFPRMKNPISNGR